MNALLSVRGLAKSFGGVRAVDDVSFDLGAGEVLALIGPNWLNARGEDGLNRLEDPHDFEPLLGVRSGFGFTLLF